MSMGISLQLKRVGGRRIYTQFENYKCTNVFSTALVNNKKVLWSFKVTSYIFQMFPFKSIRECLHTT